MKQSHKLILKQIGLKAQEYNIKAWAVGGFARDMLIGRNTEDIDICTEGDSAPLINFCIKQYGAKVKRFNDFGTARVNLSNGLKLDFVRCRAEIYQKPAALPTVRPSDLKDDLLRRDFICNALALSIMPGEFFKEYDFFNSREAILKGYIKVLHDKSFLDDPTRMFRAIRFAARFGWDIETNTENLLKLAVSAGYINLLSPQRIAHEFVKILEENNPYPALNLADKYGLLDFVFKNLKYTRKIAGLKGLSARLAYLTLIQGGNGEAFLASLLLPKQETSLSAQALHWQKSKAAPSKPLSGELIKIIKFYKPSIKPYQLKPLLLQASDIAELGFSGRQLGKKMKDLAKAQYSGKITTKSAAIRFIKNSNCAK